MQHYSTTETCLYNYAMRYVCVSHLSSNTSHYTIPLILVAVFHSYNNHSYKIFLKLGNSLPTSYILCHRIPNLSFLEFCLPTQYRHSGLLLHPLTLNDTRSVGLLWRRNQPVTDTRHTLPRDIRSYVPLDSNPQSQQANGA